MRLDLLPCRLISRAWVKIVPKRAQSRSYLQIVSWSVDNGEVFLLVSWYKISDYIHLLQKWPIVCAPSIEFALTNWAQSFNNPSGMLSQVIDGGIRRYTCADDSLSTWNHTSCGHAYLIKFSSRDIIQLTSVHADTDVQQWKILTFVFVSTHVDECWGFTRWKV